MFRKGEKPNIHKEACLSVLTTYVALQILFLKMPLCEFLFWFFSQLKTSSRWYPGPGQPLKCSAVFAPYGTVLTAPARKDFLQAGFD